jgi:hypothetical protein
VAQGLVANVPGKAAGGATEFARIQVKLQAASSKDEGGARLEPCKRV